MEGSEMDLGFLPVGMVGVEPLGDLGTRVRELGRFSHDEVVKTLAQNL